MPAGRPPKATRLKILTGNPGKRPLNAREPQPKRGVPVCPVWLDREAKAQWKRLVPELDRLGLLTVIDGAALAAACQAWSEFRQATQTLQREGRYVVNGGTTVPEKGEDGKMGFKLVGGQHCSHPAVAQQRSAWTALKGFCSLFGLSPSDRVKLVVPGGGEKDEFEEFLREKA